jgi:glycerol-3-phosphate cytidylyltransferase-like family protein
MIAGFFDPIQPGHLELFKFAANIIPGAWVVAVIHEPSDIVKKSGFYIYEPSELKELLLGYNDFINEVQVSIDTDGTVAETLRKIRPDYFVKGPDRTPENMPKNELKVCEDIDCIVIYQPGKKTGSSSSIKKRIADQLI